jgi:hypothetical protein
MFEINFCNNFLDFIEELKELLLEDWRKFKIFFKQNKDYLICLFILLITLQFTDLMSLGSSWNKYNKINNINNIQNGGGEEAPPEKSKKEVKAEKKAEKKQKKADKKAFNKTDEGKAKKKEEKQDKKDKKSAEKQAKKDSGVDDVKSPDSGGSSIGSGPIFGNFGGILQAFDGMIALLTLIMIIIGIISVPILIFLVITYCIIKLMVGKLALY